MTDLTHDQEMKLSELLHPYLDMGCWHEKRKEEGKYVTSVNHFTCQHCRLGYADDSENGVESLNPNLFTRGAFLDVFDAVKDRGTLKEFLEGDYIHIDGIVSPDFQYELLKWLLEKDGRLGELEEVMKGKGRADE